MKLIVKLLLAAFVIWEAYWAYVFISTPRPDYEMTTILAAFMGLGLPITIALILGLFPSYWKWLDRKREEARRKR